MASTSADALTLRAQWARFLVREQLARELNLSPSAGHAPWARDRLPSLSEVQPKPGGEGRPKYKLCIVGAGIAGLYIALILDTLKIHNVSFDFFEASDRIGGRCFTYKFSKVPHDYYDVGAMRFPKIDVMKR
jgi:NADPH-dependent 2,4-dienoyl-CoA reductase/sulfur reductase-like enzyme